MKNLPLAVNVVLGDNIPNQVSSNDLPKEAILRVPLTYISSTHSPDSSDIANLQSTPNDGSNIPVFTGNISKSLNTGSKLLNKLNDPSNETKFGQNKDIRVELNLTFPQNVNDILQSEITNTPSPSILSRRVPKVTVENVRDETSPIKEYQHVPGAFPGLSTPAASTTNQERRTFSGPVSKNSRGLASILDEMRDSDTPTPGRNRSASLFTSLDSAGSSRQPKPKLSTFDFKY